MAWKLGKRRTDLIRFWCWLRYGHTPALGSDLITNDGVFLTLWTCEHCGHRWIE